MNISFELYRIFYVVANVGNITKASKQLLISQPAISKNLKNLEEQLGGQLFVRTKRGVVLTEEGKEFYRYIKQAIEFINNAENKFTDMINLDVGCIKIGVSVTLTKEFLLPYLEKFHKLYPKIEIQIITNVAGELFSNLQTGLIDLVILNLPIKVSNDIEIIECREIHDCFVVNDTYKDLAKKPLNLSELNNFPLILQTKGSVTRTFIDDFCFKNDVVLYPNMNLASYTLVIEFAKIGLGIGYATKEYIKEELKTGKLYELNIEPKIPSRHIGIALSKRNLPNFSTKKLIDIILEKI